MNCPYCGEMMEKGLIQSDEEICWLRKKAFFNHADMHEGAVCLAPGSFWKGAVVEAWLCRQCEKVVIDYAQKEEKTE